VLAGVDGLDGAGAQIDVVHSQVSRSGAFLCYLSTCLQLVYLQTCLDYHPIGAAGSWRFSADPLTLVPGTRPTTDGGPIGLMLACQPQLTHYTFNRCHKMISLTPRVPVPAVTVKTRLLSPWMTSAVWVASWTTNRSPEVIV
jgi:hypothetical protein